VVVDEAVASKLNTEDDHNGVDLEQAPSP